MSYAVHHGDCLATLPTLDPDSIDACVTDPPYGLAFMGKEWDHGVPGEDFWRGVLRVLKPGAHLLAFGGTRTFHRLTCAIEDAGFEVRDCLMWLYGSGFPKSHNLSGDQQGLGTALKPAWEPIILARKPLTGTVAANVERYGTGAVNVDGCRIGTEGGQTRHTRSDGAHRDRWVGNTSTGEVTQNGGRWPANLLLDEEAAAMLDGQTGTLTSGSDCTRTKTGTFLEHGGLGHAGDAQTTYGDSGGASRFFYTVREDSACSRTANTAGESLSLQSQSVVSALSDAVTSASLGATRVSDYRAPSTSVTPSVFARIITTVTTLTMNTAPECLPVSLRISITPTGSHASHAETPSQTDTMTITLDRSTCAGSAASATSSTTQPSGEAGEPDFAGQVRFKYCAKASRSERNAGLEGMETTTTDDGRQTSIDNPFLRGETKRQNHHPTVKPLALMRYLCRLVTPPGGVVLDPFMGSGSTGCAAVAEGFSFVGIEREAEYIEIARRRIEHHEAQQVCLVS